jgi:hypothetical protein
MKIKIITELLPTKTNKTERIHALWLTYQDQVSIRSQWMVVQYLQVATKRRLCRLTASSVHDAGALCPAAAGHLTLRSLIRTSYPLTTPSS